MTDTLIATHKRDYSTGVGNPKRFMYFFLSASLNICRSSTEVGLDESSVVKAWWKINIGDKSDFIRLLVRSYTLNADKEEIQNLATEFNIDNEACKTHIQKEGLTWDIDQDAFIVHAFKPSICCGFGQTLLEALCDFHEQSVHG